MPSSRAASPRASTAPASVIVWDRGRWSTEGDPHQQLAKGHLEFELDGSKLKGRWHLVHMKGRDKGAARRTGCSSRPRTNTRREGGGDDLLEAKPRSVKTGRTIEAVGKSEVKIKRKAG